MIHKSICEIAHAYRNNSTSPIDLFKLINSNISKSKKFLDIFISQNAKLDHYISESTSNISQKLPLSLLEGIPISIKDNLCTLDMPTTCASQILKGILFSLLLL